MERMFSKLAMAVLLFTAVLFSSCSDDDKTTVSTTLTKTQYLTASRWYLESSSDATFNGYGSAWFFDFKADKTWAGMTPGQSGLSSASGTWSFNASETQLIVNEDVDVTTLDIVTLNATTMTITMTMDGNTVTFTFDHVQ